MTETIADPITPPPRRRWRRLAMLLLIFVCGGIVGAVGGSVWMRERMLTILRHPERVPDRILPRIRSELSLTEEQTQRVEEIVRHRHALMESLRAETYSQQLSEFRAMHDDVAEILTREQRSKWSSLCDFIEQRYLPTRPAGPPPADLLFDRFDANSDGALAEDEVPPGLWRRLHQADKNRDGKVSREESW